MTENGKICVIVPLYKVEKYLPRCVESILAQTYSNYELILVDDGSPDNCPKMCDEYAEKYSFIHVIHKENGGQGAARNVALDWAYKNLDFTYITFIDSDDYVHRKYFEVLLNALTANGVDISCCGYVVNGNFEQEIDLNNQTVQVNSANELCFFQSHDVFNIGVPWGRLFKKELFRYLRYPTDRYYEDGFTVYKALFAVEKIALCSAKLYCWFQNEDSTTRSTPNPKKINDYIDAMVETVNYLKVNGFNKAYRQEVNTFFYRLTLNEKTNGDTKTLNKVNGKFKKAARKIVKSDRKTYNYFKYSDVYEIAFSPLTRFIYKLLDRKILKNVKK